MPWLRAIEPSLPYWQDCLPYFKQLNAAHFPDCDQLNAMLPDGLISHGGQAIVFVPSTELHEAPYEHRIYTSGQVSTRPENWHDLFNALVWMQFPRTKSTMNALHYKEMRNQPDGYRGPLRDALTLFDECGVIVFSSHENCLRLLARRDWARAFKTAQFNDKVSVAVSGHAMLEKFLAPYKSMTAKAIYLLVNDDFLDLPRKKQLKKLDEGIANLLRSGSLITTPANLAPLPLVGIPGWWPDRQQDDNFYDDELVFRPPPVDLVTAPLIALDAP